MAINIQQSIAQTISDFLVSQPSLEAIAAYQAPPAMQELIDAFP